MDYKAKCKNCGFEQKFILFLESFEGWYWAFGCLKCKKIFSMVNPPDSTLKNKECHKCKGKIINYWHEYRAEEKKAAKEKKLTCPSCGKKEMVTEVIRHKYKV